MDLPVDYIWIFVHFRADITFTAFLEGKNVFLTGASRGIGEQMAYVYARAGANLFITARSEDRLQKVKVPYINKHVVIKKTCQ